VVVLEAHARLLLIVHAIIGAATVAVTTHLTFWVRGTLRGEPRLYGVRWFGVAALLLFATQFTLGNLLYPTYKVRVRGEYLDRPATIAAEARLRRPDAPADTPAPRLSHVATLFDIKEHLVALALPLVAAACALAWAWRPDRDGPLAGRVLYGCAITVAATTWFAAIAGLVVTSYRAVG
jgi:hypothetical protein